MLDKDKAMPVVQNMPDDDVADELIAQHPGFRASIERARQQKAKSQAKTLAEMRRKYPARSGGDH
ncbi:MAG: hypothetical protein HY782_21265 [Chloroflexi bacterium]|nr:hypothetical protein [Chloroflexota bacterium]